MPHANSRFSRPRAISPSASDGHLAVLGRQVRRELLAVGLDQVPDLEHDVGALRQRRRAPAGKAAFAAATAADDLLDRGEVDVLRQLSGRRVVDGALAPGRAGHGPSADPVADPTRRAGDPWWPCPALRPVSSEHHPLQWKDHDTPRASPTARAGAGQNLGRVSGSGQPRSDPARSVGRRSRRPRHADARLSTTSAATQPIAMPIAISPLALSCPATRRIAPRRRHGRPGGRPQADPDEEQPPVAAAERADHQGAASGRPGCRASRSPSSACDGTDGRAGTSEPHGPGPR